MLARSQDAPLVVHHRIAANHRRFEDYSLQAALDALPRIRVLKLDIPWETYRKISDKLLAHAPLLQYLVLYTSNMLSCIGRAPPVLPLQHSVQPALEIINLAAYSVSWPSLATCRNLRQFSIDFAPFMRPTLHTVEEVLHTLRELPLLETISLSNVLLTPLPQPGEENPQLHTVEAPNLNHLALCGDAAPCASLLNNLVHPSSTRLTLNFAHISETDLPLILPSIRNKFSGASTLGRQAITPFHGLTFGIDFKRSFFVRGWAPPVGLDSEMIDVEDLESRSTFQLEMPRWILEHTTFWDSLPLQDVQTLWILSSPSDELTVDRALDVLVRTPSITSIHFVKWSSRHVEELLWTRPYIITLLQMRAPQVPVRKLKHLVLRDAAFEPCIDHRNGHSGCMRHLVDALDARSRAGAMRLDCIELQKCLNIDGFQIPPLRRVVGQVKWDGVIRVPSDDIVTDSETESVGGEVVEG